MEGDPDFRPWNELIPDALGLIFKNLDLQEVLQVIPVVCKSWCKVVEGPYCWERIDTDDCILIEQSTPLLDRDRLLRTLITRSSGSLQELCVSCIDDQMFSFIAQHAGSLQTLKLRESSISDSVFEQFATKSASLTTLDLTTCDGISIRTLEAISRNCKALVSLSLNRVELDEDESVTISHTMPKLKHLSLTYLGINCSVVLDLLSACPMLESLDIQGSWYVTLDPILLEEKYPDIKVVGPEIRALSVSDHSGSSEDDDSDSRGDHSSNESEYCGYYDFGSESDDESSGNDDYDDYGDYDSSMCNSYI